MTISEIIADLHEKQNIPAAHALETTYNTLREVLDENGEICDYCIHCELEFDECLHNDSNCRECSHSECPCWLCHRSDDSSEFEFDYEDT